MMKKYLFILCAMLLASVAYADELQMLYQHPEVSFNPRLTLYHSLTEPYQVMKKPYSRFLWKSYCKTGADLL